MTSTPLPKLAFSSLGCPEWDLPTIAAEAARHGIDAVELRGGAEGHVSPLLSVAARRALRERFAAAGVAIAGVTAYSDFTTLDSRVLRDQEDELLRHVELARDLGARYVRALTGRFEARRNPRLVAQAAASLQRAGERGARLGVQVLVENRDIPSICELGLVLAPIPARHVGLLWDISNSRDTGESYEDAWDIVWRRLGCCVHVKDSRARAGGRDHCHVGDGDVPLRRAMVGLRDLRFDGYLCLEWERAWHPEMPPLQEALPRFKQFVAAAWRTAAES